MRLILTTPCAPCQGTGQVTLVDSYGSTEEVVCEMCNGTSWVLTEDGQTVAALVHRIAADHEFRRRLYKAEEADRGALRPATDETDE